MSSIIDAAELKDFNAAMIRHASNGESRLGLEVGTDPGLARNLHVQIPHSCAREVSSRLKQDAYDLYCDFMKEPKAKVYDHDGTLNATTIRSEEGWAEMKELYIFDKKKMIRVQRPSDNKVAYFEIDQVLCQPIDIDMVRDFVVANWEHVGNVDEDAKPWIIAVRFWCTMAGLITANANREFTPVPIPDPADYAKVPNMKDVLTEVIKLQEFAYSCASARCLTWRRTNHCTGGSVAVAYIQKTMGDKWNVTGTDADAKAKRQKCTTHFYNATHAISVHAGLAQFVTMHDDHWARINCDYGVHINWKLENSVLARCRDKGAVAGAARVMDSVAIFGMLLSENMTPFLKNGSQVKALLKARAAVEKGGMVNHVGAGWFYEQCPSGKRAVRFSQTQSDFAEITMELGAIARIYYKNTTTGRAPALQALHDQCQDQSIKNMWAQLAQARMDAGIDAIMKAVQLIHGTAAAGATLQLTSSREVEVRAGVVRLNEILKEHVQLLNDHVDDAHAVLTEIDEEKAVERAAEMNKGKWVDGKSAAPVAPAPATGV